MNPVEQQRWATSTSAALIRRLLARESRVNIAGIAECRAALALAATGELLAGAGITWDGGSGTVSRPPAWRSHIPESGPPQWQRFNRDLGQWVDAEPDQVPAELVDLMRLDGPWRCWAESMPPPMFPRDPR